MSKNVLVIDPVAVNRIRLSSLLDSAHYAVTAVASVEDAQRMPVAPDVIVIGSPGDGRVRAEALPTGPVAPVLCLDGDPTPLRRLAALRAGAREVLPRSAPDTLLLARLRGLIRDGEAERERERRQVTAASFGFAEAGAGFDVPARVVTVDATSVLPELTKLLGSTLPHACRSAGVEEVLRDEGSEAADAYVVVSGPEAQVLDRLLPELRDRSHSRHASVMEIHPAERPDIATRALDLGASEIAAETSCGEELALRIDTMVTRKRQRDALRRSDEQSYRLAATDPLTGLYNRRYAEAYLGDLMMRSGEGGCNFVLMVLDLDHFKSINDRYGHPGGDRVLCEVAYRLRDNLRACDLVSRHGGEEFLVVLPETELAEAAHTAERLREAVSRVPVVIDRARSVRVTASIGVATGQILGRMGAARTGTFDVAEVQAPPALERVMEAADAALYRAKETGRDRVEFSVG